MSLFIIYCLVMTIGFVTSNPSSYCLPIQPIHSDVQVQPQPEMGQQGRPGRIGPVGPAGPPGRPGAPGECECEPSEIDRLRTEMENANARLKTEIQELNGECLAEQSPAC